MIEIYRAIAIDSIAIKGGSTKPCIMTVADDTGKIVGSYVVKVFNQNHIQTHPTQREVICNVLAQEFDLSVPKMALIQVDKFIISELQKSGYFSGKLILPGIYFGSLYIQGAVDYSPATPTASFEAWELKTIFAFDILIRNVDRRVNKPNLLLKDENFYLIDHELCFGATKWTFQQCLDNGSWNFISKKSPHLFLERLRELEHPKAGLLEFETFFYYLKRLNIDKLNVCEDVFNNIGYDTVDFMYIKDYLYDIKHNPQIFETLLLRIIFLYE